MPQTHIVSFVQINICVTNVNGLSSCRCTWHREATNLPNQNTRQPVPPQSAVSEIQEEVTENQYPNVTEWVLPSQISQSNMFGRYLGSNACTVIAVLSGLHFLEGTLTVPTQRSDLNQILPVYGQLIHEGNQIYDSLNMPPQQPNLDVTQVLQQNINSLDKLSIMADTGFFTTQDLEDFFDTNCAAAETEFFCCTNCSTRQIFAAMFLWKKHLSF